MSIPVPALTAEQLATVLQNALDQHAHKEGNLLPLLHSIQDQLRYIPAAIVPLLSTAINRSRAEIHGVISFYTHFRTQPPLLYCLNSVVLNPVRRVVPTI